jgi:uncharacterized protein (DUF4415 family)
MKKAASKRLTREQRAELKSLTTLRDDEIDTSDAPELLDWSGARRGLFYRPVKQQLILRLDADVVAWFKSQTASDEGYQTRINRALREYVQSHARRRRHSRRTCSNTKMEQDDDSRKSHPALAPRWQTASRLSWQWNRAAWHAAP